MCTVTKTYEKTFDEYLSKIFESTYQLCHGDINIRLLLRKCLSVFHNCMGLALNGLTNRIIIPHAQGCQQSIWMDNVTKTACVVLTRKRRSLDSPINYSYKTIMMSATKDTFLRLMLVIPIVTENTQ